MRNTTDLKHLLEENKDKFQFLMFFTFFPDKEDGKFWDIGIMRRKEDNESELVSGLSGDNMYILVDQTCKNIEEYIKNKGKE